MNNLNHEARITRLEKELRLTKQQLMQYAQMQKDEIEFILCLIFWKEAMKKIIPKIGRKERTYD